MADVAVIGSGIAGLGCAWWLTECGHQVTVYAGGTHVGGHGNTVLAATRQGKTVPVDTGFTVFCQKSYPNLSALLQRLSVPVQNTEMSFSASLYNGAIEYSTHSLRSLFAQPLLAFSPEHWSMLTEIRRFGREAPLLLQKEENPTLLEFLQAHSYSDGFVSRFLVPVCSAIWSSAPTELMGFPAKFIFGCLKTHGLILQPANSVWSTITGGSTQLTQRLSASFADRILPQPATRIKRTKAGPLVESAGTYKAYDAVVLACHADEALALLVDPTENEQAVLGAIRYAQSDLVLHQDESLMPGRAAAWASWNYLSHPEGKISVTGWMNNLQDISDDTPLFTTLNPPHQPRPELTLARFAIRQPVFDQQAVLAQTYTGYLQGVEGIWYCGSWTGYGLHEDALTSGLTVAEYLSGQRRPWTVTETSPAAVFVPPVPLSGEAAA